MQLRPLVDPDAAEAAKTGRIGLRRGWEPQARSLEAYHDMLLLENRSLPTLVKQRRGAPRAVPTTLKCSDPIARLARARNTRRRFIAPVTAHGADGEYDGSTTHQSPDQNSPNVELPTDAVANDNELNRPLDDPAAGGLNAALQSPGQSPKMSPGQTPQLSPKNAAGQSRTNVPKLHVTSDHGSSIPSDDSSGDTSFESDDSGSGFDGVFDDDNDALEQTLALFSATGHGIDVTDPDALAHSLQDLDFNALVDKSFRRTPSNRQRREAGVTIASPKHIGARKPAKSPGGRRPGSGKGKGKGKKEKKRDSVFGTANVALSDLDGKIRGVDSAEAKAEARRRASDAVRIRTAEVELLQARKMAEEAAGPPADDRTKSKLRSDAVLRQVRAEVASANADGVLRSPSPPASPVGRTVGPHSPLRPPTLSTTDFPVLETHQSGGGTGGPQQGEAGDDSSDYEEGGIRWSAGMLEALHDAHLAKAAAAPPVDEAKALEDAVFLDPKNSSDSDREWERSRRQRLLHGVPGIGIDRQDSARPRRQKRRWSLEENATAAAEKSAAAAFVAEAERVGVSVVNLGEVQRRVKTRRRIKNDAKAKRDRELEERRLRILRGESDGTDSGQASSFNAHDHLQVPVSTAQLIDSSSDSDDQNNSDDAAAQMSSLFSPASKRGFAARGDSWSSFARRLKEAGIAASTAADVKSIRNAMATAEADQRQLSASAEHVNVSEAGSSGTSPSRGRSHPQRSPRTTGRKSDRGGGGGGALGTGRSKKSDRSTGLTPRTLDAHPLLRHLGFQQFREKLDDEAREERLLAGAAAAPGDSDYETDTTASEEEGAWAGITEWGRVQRFWRKNPPQPRKHRGAAEQNACADGDQKLGDEGKQAKQKKPLSAQAEAALVARLATPTPSKLQKARGNDSQHSISVTRGGSTKRTSTPIRNAASSSKARAAQGQSPARRQSSASADRARAFSLVSLQSEDSVNTSAAPTRRATVAPDANNSRATIASSIRSSDVRAGAGLTTSTAGSGGSGGSNGTPVAAAVSKRHTPKDASMMAAPRSIIMSRPGSAGTSLPPRHDKVEKTVRIQLPHGAKRDSEIDLRSVGDDDSVRPAPWVGKPPVSLAPAALMRPGSAGTNASSVGPSSTGLLGRQMFSGNQPALMDGGSVNAAQQEASPTFVRRDTVAARRRPSAVSDFATMRARVRLNGGLHNKHPLMPSAALSGMAARPHSAGPPAMSHQQVHPSASGLRPGSGSSLAGSRPATALGFNARTSPSSPAQKSSAGAGPRVGNAGAPLVRAGSAGASGRAVKPSSAATPSELQTSLSVQARREHAVLVKEQRRKYRTATDTTEQRLRIREKAATALWTAAMRPGPLE